MRRKRNQARKEMFLVDRDFQFRYTGAAIVVGLISTILTCIVILYPLYVFEILRIPQFLPLPILFMMLLAAVINIALVALMGIFLTHRIAGPIYAMVRCIREVDQGRYTEKMKIRDNDELGFLVRNFNAMVTSLHTRTENDILALEAIDEDLKKDEKIASNEELLSRFSEIKEAYKKRISSSSKNGKAVS